MLLIFAFLLIPITADGQTNSAALPPRGISRIGATKLRHGDRILCLAYAPDSELLAAGGGNDVLRLWNPKTGDLVQTINEPWVHAMAFTPSGHTLLFGGSQRSIRLWNFKLGKETGRLDGHKATIKALAVSPDATTIASGSQDGLISLWNMENKRKVIELTGHTEEITSLAFSPIDSNVFASAAGDGTIRFWSVETYNTLKKIDAGAAVSALAFSADGKTLFSAGDDRLIRRWDVATGKPTGVFKGHEDAVTHLAVLKDKLLSGSPDRTIRIWDPQTTEQRKSFPLAPGNCDALAVTNSGDFVASAGINGVVNLIETNTGKEVHRSAGPQAGIVSMLTSADGSRFAALTSDGQVFLGDPRAGSLLRQWDTKQTGDLLLAFASEGKILATASSRIRLWDADAGTDLGELPIKNVEPINSLALSPDGATLAVGFRGAQIELWDTKTKARVGTFKCDGPLYAVSWSPDGKRLAAAGGSKIFVWDRQTEFLVKSFPVKEGPATGFPTIRTLVFGPDNNSLAAGGWDAVIRVYNLRVKNPADPKDVRLCEGHLSSIFSLAFSADGRTLVSGSFDRTVRLWEAFSGKQIAIYKGHVGEVQGVAFHHDGRSIWSAGSDASLLRWDVPGLTNDGKLPELTLGVQELDAAWGLLASEETPRGHEMMWRCIASSKQAVPQLTKRLYYLEPEQVKKWFRDLDSMHFPTRLLAMKNLEDKGRWMEGRYDEALASSPSLEYKRRIEILKEKLATDNSPSIAQERLRVRRIMLICEQVGSPEAIEALRKIADKGPEEDLRDEARASLQRLKK